MLGKSQLSNDNWLFPFYLLISAVGYGKYLTAPFIFCCTAKSPFNIVSIVSFTFQLAKISITVCGINSRLCRNR